MRLRPNIVSHQNPAIPPTPRHAALHREPAPAFIVALRAGSPDAIGACYREYAPRLLQLALRLTGEQAEAEDVVQDVFVGLPEAMHRYEERGAFGAWLRRLTTTHALMRQRRVRNRREVADGEEMLRHVAREDISHDSGVVERAVQSLAPGLREVFVLRVVEGYSHGEIAALLGINVGTSEVRLSRALKALRELLGGSL